MNNRSLPSIHLLIFLNMITTARKRTSKRWNIFYNNILCVSISGGYIYVILNIHVLEMLFSQKNLSFLSRFLFLAFLCCIVIYGCCVDSLDCLRAFNAIVLRNLCVALKYFMYTRLYVYMYTKCFVYNPFRANNMFFIRTKGEE